MNPQYLADVKLLIPASTEASIKAHQIAINQAKKHPVRFYEVYLEIYNREFTVLFNDIIKQFG
jgi:hypothetical protein